MRYEIVFVLLLVACEPIPLTSHPEVVSVFSDSFSSCVEMCKPLQTQDCRDAVAECVDKECEILSLPYADLGFRTYSEEMDYCFGREAWGACDELKVGCHLSVEETCFELCRGEA